MRIGALLLVGFGVLMSGACTTANPPDEECIVNQGTCFETIDPVGCASILPYGCATGYTCCSATNASNIVDGAVLDAGGPLFDAGAPADATSEAGVDAAADAGKKSDAGDATVAQDSGTHDSGRADAKDATTGHDSGDTGTKDSGGTVTKDTGAPKDSGSPLLDAAKSKDSSADVAHDAADAG